MSYKRILTGTDGSPPSLEGVRHAATVAKAYGAELVIMCVYRPVDPVTVEQWKEQAPDEFAWRLGGLPIRGGSHDQPLHRLDVPAGADELRGEPVQ